MVLDNYVLLSIKSSLGIVTEPQTLFDVAMTRESQIDAGSLTDPLDQARSNLKFIDRAETIIAGFQDTHFSGRPVVAAHREYTSAFTLTDDIKASPDVGGYDQKMVALVTPFCISACEGMSTLLKTSKRATIIGTHSNGTGSGFIGSGPFEELVWQDRYKVMNLRIPNRLFGPGGSVGTHVYDTPTAYADMNSENRPTVADVTYDWAIGDYTGKGLGWYQKAMDTLDQP